MTVQEMIENSSFRTRSYSGRGMFGRECLAFTASENVGSIVGDLLDEAYNMDDVESLKDAFRGMKTDSMGFDTVFYFPHIPYVESEEEDED